jgi:hypothetical protein
MKQSKQQLRRKITDLESQLTSRLYWAGREIDSCSTDKLLGSGVVMQLTFLGGKDAMEPVCIRDGLSRETIDAIKADLKRSYDLATLLKL